MSNIHSNSAAVRQVVASRSDAVPAPTPVRRQGQSKDQALMYAWSIGTTRVAQERAIERTVPPREECPPPEVYIG